MNALVTMAISDEYKAIGKITFPLLRSYAERCDMAFYNIDWQSYHTMPVWERMARLYEMLFVYGRILVAEVDVIPSPTARNVMDLLPAGTFYGFDEYPFDPKQCEPCWQSAMDTWSDEFPQSRDYPKHLYNTGLMLIDQSHRELFAPVSNETDHGMMDMAVVNMRLHKYDMSHKDVRPEIFNASHLWFPGQPRPDFLHVMWETGSKMNGVQEFMSSMGYDRAEWC